MIINDDTLYDQPDSILETTATDTGNESNIEGGAKVNNGDEIDEDRNDVGFVASRKGSKGLVNVQFTLL